MRHGCVSRCVGGCVSRCVGGSVVGESVFVSMCVSVVFVGETWVCQ